MKRILIKINQFQDMKKVLFCFLFFMIWVVKCVLHIVLMPIVSLFHWIFYAARFEFKRLLVYAPQDVRNIFPNTFDENGLKYSRNFLEQIFEDVAKMELAKQAAYADLNTVKWVDLMNENDDEYDAEFFEILRQEQLKNAYSDLNTTAVGNLAYIACNLKATKQTGWFANDCFNYLSELRGYALTHFVD